MTSLWPFKAPPFEVQTEALKRAATSTGRGYMQFMEQGLGKTAVALAEYIRLRNAGLVDCMIVVCPNGLKGNWEDEAKGLGADVKMSLWPWKGRPEDVMVLNYESLTLGSVTRGPITLGRGGEAVLEIMDKRRAYVCLDESHRIKNPQSNTARFFLQHAVKRPCIRRGGTGTPYGNSPLDVYTQLRWAGLLNGINPVTFRNDYAKMGGFQGKRIVDIKEERLDEFHTLLDSVSFRATKAVWAKHIPDKVYRPTRTTIPDSLSKMYREMQEDFVLMLDDVAITAPMIITQMIKLQQISSGAVMDGDRMVHELLPIKKLPKFQSVLDIIDANGQSKTLIFAYFRPTIDRLLDGLEAETGARPAYIRGNMSDDEIRHQKALFNDDAGPGQMVVQTTAGKEGHTLLGGETRRCYTEIFFETPYSLIARKQCEDRAHRHGQKDALLVCDFVSSPIEEMALAALHKHEDVAHRLLDQRREGNL